MFPVQLSAFSRIVSTAASVAEEALSWITPAKGSGRASAWRSQSIIRVSISVAAGEVCHNIHCGASAEARNSARTEAGAALEAK